MNKDYDMNMRLHFAISYVPFHFLVRAPLSVISILRRPLLLLAIISAFFMFPLRKFFLSVCPKQLVFHSLIHFNNSFSPTISWFCTNGLCITQYSVTLLNGFYNHSTRVSWSLAIYRDNFVYPKCSGKYVKQKRMMFGIYAQNGCTTLRYKPKKRRNVVKLEED